MLLKRLLTAGDPAIRAALIAPIGGVIAFFGERFVISTAILVAIASGLQPFARMHHFGLLWLKCLSSMRQVPVYL